MAHPEHRFVFAEEGKQLLQPVLESPMLQKLGGFSSSHAQPERQAARRALLPGGKNQILEGQEGKGFWWRADGS
jgi:hypothetical protein